MINISDYAKLMRKLALLSIYHAGSGHPGGSMSIIDILVYLYFKEMHIDSLYDPDRDRFVLSKGHACPALYAVLSEKGFINRNELWRLRHTDAMLQGHPEVGTPGIEAASGSLGQGFSAALGMALGAKRLKMSFRVYTILGDGECNEGQVWEGAMFGAHHKLDNMVVVIDYNGLQSDDRCDNITSLGNIASKWVAFNWNVVEIDGHNFRDIERAFQLARKTNYKPTCIIAHTIKGKGVSFMEDNPKWHGSKTLTGKELEIALKEIENL